MKNEGATGLRLCVTERQEKACHGGKDTETEGETEGRNERGLNESRPRERGAFLAPLKNITRLFLFREFDVWVLFLFFFLSLHHRPGIKVFRRDWR